MPSTIVGYPVASGPQPLISGNPWSGSFNPESEIRLKLDRTASGSVYVGLSGNITMTSGSYFLSGGGLNDGYCMLPGDEYRIPRSAMTASGTINVYMRHDAACSGQARIHYELF